MKKIALTLALVLTVIFGGIAQNWKPTTASVTFRIKHALGAYATGNFTGFAGSVNFDPNNLGGSSLFATIKTETFDTDNSMRDKELKSDAYFDAAKYPKITMRSTAILKGSGADEYIGTFDLTIKDKTKSVRVPFTFTESGSSGTFKAQFSIDRTEYGVGEASKLLSNTAKVNITLNVKK